MHQHLLQFHTVYINESQLLQKITKLSYPLGQQTLCKFFKTSSKVSRGLNFLTTNRSSIAAELESDTLLRRE